MINDDFDSAIQMKFGYKDWAHEYMLLYNAIKEGEIFTITKRNGQLVLEKGTVPTHWMPLPDSPGVEVEE